MKFRLSAKKLNSGRFQVRFDVKDEAPGYYGYLLAESRTPLMEVVGKIGRHLKAMENVEKYFHRNLYSLGLHNVHSGKILVFKNSLKNGCHSD